MNEKDIEAHQAGLVRLTAALVAAAKSGNYRQAGRVFTRLLEAQAAVGGLPEAAGYDQLLAQLNAIPSKILGIREVDE